MRKKDAALFIIEDNIKSKLEIMTLFINWKYKEHLYDHLLLLQGVAQKELVH